MPLCQLYTNISCEKLAEGVEEKIVKGIANILEKPVERCVLAILPNTRLFSKGSYEPACLLTISSVQVFSVFNNSKYTPFIKKLIHEELNVPSDRITIQYIDLDQSFLGN